MQKRVVVILMVALLSFTASYVTLVHAFSYNVEQVGNSFVDQPWTIRATTDDPAVTQVSFSFYFLDGPSPANTAFTVPGSSPFDGTMTPDQAGHWRCDVVFQTANGQPISSLTKDEQILPFGFIQIIPEVPIVGTLGIVIVMLIALFALVYIKRRNPAK